MRAIHAVLRSGSRRPADEIVERTKDILSVNAIEAANASSTQSTTTPQNAERPAPQQRIAAHTRRSESPEQVNHNVTAVHGVVLLPPKNEVTSWNLERIKTSESVREHQRP